MNLKKLTALFPSLILIKSAYAHCPLCTVGAATAAGGAAWLGVDNSVIGVFVGAFAISTGWWISRLIRKQYIPFQRILIIIISFLTTVIPLLPIMSGVHPFYLSLAGEYGSFLNRTYLLNTFLIGSIIGGIIASLTPWLSSRIGQLRNGKLFPFQGIILTFVLLLLVGAVIQLLM